MSETIYAVKHLHDRGDGYVERVASAHTSEEQAREDLAEYSEGGRVVPIQLYGQDNELRELIEQWREQADDDVGGAAWALGNCADELEEHLNG
jgi:predicted ATPase